MVSDVFRIFVLRYQQIIYYLKSRALSKVGAHLGFCLSGGGWRYLAQRISGEKNEDNFPGFLAAMQCLAFGPWTYFGEVDGQEAKDCTCLEKFRVKDV